MDTITTCKCGKKLKIPERLLGKKVKCPACNELLLVGAVASTALEVQVRQEGPKNNAESDYELELDEGDKPTEPEDKKSSKGCLLGCGLFILIVIILACLPESERSKEERLYRERQEAEKEARSQRRAKEMREQAEFNRQRNAVTRNMTPAQRQRYDDAIRSGDSDGAMGAIGE